MTGFEKAFLRGLVFTPAECYVNRTRFLLASALQRSAMSVLLEKNEVDDGMAKPINQSDSP